MIETFKCNFKDVCKDFDTCLCASCVHSNLRSFYEPRPEPVTHYYYPSYAPYYYRPFYPGNVAGQYYYPNVTSGNSAP